jgi:hypothetical protein
VIVVGGEHETELLERVAAGGALEPDGQAPVRALAHAGERWAVVDFEGHRENSVAEDSRGVALEPGRDGERIRRSRDDRGLEGHAASLTRRSEAPAREGS